MIFTTQIVDAHNRTPKFLINLWFVEADYILLMHALLDLRSQVCSCTHREHPAVSVQIPDTDRWDDKA